MGRPTLLDDLVAQRIVAAVSKGASREAAASAARISRSTLQDWLRRGAEGEEPYASLVERVLAAHGELHVTVSGYLLEIAEDCDHAPTRLGAIKALLERLDRVDGAAVVATPKADEQRDAASDLDVARSVVAALESRARKVA